MIRLKQLLEQDTKKIGNVLQQTDVDRPVVTRLLGNFKNLDPAIFNTMNGPQLTARTAGSDYKAALSGFKFNLDFTIATKTLQEKLLKLTWVRMPQNFNVEYNGKKLGEFNTITFEKWLKKQIDVLNIYLSSKETLIPLYQKIEQALGDKFTKKHFNDEIAYSGGLKDVASSLNKTAVQKFNDMVARYGLVSSIKPNSFRTYEDQKTIFLKMAANHGGTINGALKQAALPGYSQHHTGKAFDITNYYKITDKMLNAYGFTRPYNSVNNFRMVEPWHIYYKG